MAHLGLKPQSVHRYGGYKCQGKTAEEALAIIEDAKLLEEVGAVALLLEAVPGEVARLITERTDLPVIGCAAGPHCDGTVVVLHDMLGYTAGHPPRSIKRYAQMHRLLAEAFQAYAGDVVAKRFPEEDHAVSMPAGEYERLTAVLAERG